MIRPRCIPLVWLTLALAFAAPTALAADAFVPAGTRGTLEVEYRFVSAGTSTKGQDVREWQISRTITMQVDLSAQAPAPTTRVGPQDAAVSADIADRRQRAAAVARDMQPTIDSVEKIMEKCGDNEACIQRESMKLAMTTDTAARMESQRGQVAAISKPMTTRYQHWEAKAEKGSYAIDERVKLVHDDPICLTLPKARCTRTEKRTGTGALPPPPGSKGPIPGIGAVEFDVQKGTVTVVLPQALVPLTVDETIETNEPHRLDERGTRKKQLAQKYRDDKSALKPVTVATKGSMRRQSGQQTHDFTDDDGNAGRLTIKWSFAAR